MRRRGCDPGPGTISTSKRVIKTPREGISAEHRRIGRPMFREEVT